MRSCCLSSCLQHYCQQIRLQTGKGPCCVQAGLDGKREPLAAPAHPPLFAVGLAKRLQLPPCETEREMQRRSGRRGLARMGKGSQGDQIAADRPLGSGRPGARLRSRGHERPPPHRPWGLRPPLQQRPAAGPAAILPPASSGLYRPSLASRRPSFPGNSGRQPMGPWRVRAARRRPRRWWRRGPLCGVAGDHGGGTKRGQGGSRVPFLRPMFSTPHNLSEFNLPLRALPVENSFMSTNPGRSKGRHRDRFEGGDVAILMPPFFLTPPPFPTASSEKFSEPKKKKMVTRLISPWSWNTCLT